MPAFDKIVVVTQKTALDELVERYNTRDQARFYLERMGTPYEPYQQAHDAYRGAFNWLKKHLPGELRSQVIERSLLPNFLFGERDLVVVLGRDGLVVNAAKYLSKQPIVAFNPDPHRIDGVLLPFSIGEVDAAFQAVLSGKTTTRRMTMAKASLNDGQSLLAVNDLFIGQQTHVSARYRLQFQEREEDQSSSGIIVSTGAGSTGWFRSILAGAAGVAEGFDRKKTPRLRERYQFSSEAEHLYFSVREPFASKASGAELTFGRIDRDDELIITSQMPQRGVIFSDGVEADYLEFNSGRIARIGVADRKVNLVVPAGRD